jgi:teichuronic acid biosynthesis glycosyltransferase TuaG
VSTISIITPVFNASKYIPTVYKSLCAQTFSDWEWVVIDDCSTDDSFPLIKRLTENDPRVKVFQNDKNSGPSVSRNRGLDVSSGIFIAFIDADDLWLPSKLERQLQFMQNHRADFSCHNYEIMSESGAFIRNVRIPSLVGTYELKAFNPIATSFVMIKKSIIGTNRFDPTLKRRQDWVFWYYLAKKNHVCLGLQENLGRYRRDSVHSISKNKFHMAWLQWTMYRKYFHFGILKSAFSFLRYAWYGFSKHYLG